MGRCKNLGPLKISWNISNYLRACFAFFLKTLSASSCPLCWILFRVNCRSVTSVANDLVLVEPEWQATIKFFFFTMSLRKKKMVFGCSQIWAQIPYFATIFSKLHSWFKPSSSLKHILWLVLYISKAGFLKIGIWDWIRNSFLWRTDVYCRVFNCISGL